MNNDKSIHVHDQTAPDYDRLAAEYGYCFADALFGLCYEFLQPGQRLLDIGIGTGLSSLPFKRAGLDIYGLDGSAEMLHICRAKNFTVELKEWDLRSLPWPYADNFFDHVIACGVFHFIPNLEPLFREVSRLVKPQGIYAFTSKVAQLDRNTVMKENFTLEAIDGVKIHSHYEGFVNKLSSRTGFEKLKELKFLQSCGMEGQYDTYTAFVCRRMR